MPPVESPAVSVQERALADQQRAPDGTPSTASPPTSTWPWLPVVAVVAAVVGSVARFVTVSALWLDEALSVNIASVPVGDLAERLRHDGHPPLYYLLLHGWMKVFGDGDVAVRALSGVIGVLTLPIAFVVGRRIGGRTVGWLSVLVLGVLPFAARYGTEARMYSLVMLLVLCGWLALDEALRRPRWSAWVALGAVTGALLLTHYWSIYLLGAVGLVLVGRAWRGDGEVRRTSVRALLALAAGGLLFLPWLPSFLEQAAHTGTPWGSPERPTKVFALLFSDLGGVDNSERILWGVVLGVLALLALFGRAVDARTVELDLRTRPEVRRELLVVVVTIGLAVAAGYATHATFAPRYFAIVAPLVVLAAATGLARFAGQVALAVAVAAYLGVSALGLVDVITFERTQVAEIAEVIEARGSPGDLVVYCPDQLGPAGSRALGDEVEQVTYPDLGDPHFVDWVDYEQRNDAADPDAFVREVLRRAEGRTIWLVWSPEYVTLEGQCDQVQAGLSRARGGGPAVNADSDAFFENANLHRYPAR